MPRFLPAIARGMRAVGARAGPVAASKSGQMLAIGFANVALGLLVTLILARLLVPAEFGAYALALNLAQLLTLPVEFGVLTLTVREVARARARADDDAMAGMVLFAAVLLMSGCTIMFIAVAAARAFGWTIAELPWLLQLWMFAAVVPLAMMNWARGVLLGFERAIDSALSENILRPILQIVLVLAFALAGPLDAVDAMIALCAALLLCFLWSVGRLRSSIAGRIRPARLRRAHFPLRAWFGALLPLALTNGARMINRRIDVVMVGFLASTLAVAGYSIAMQLTSVILVAQTVLNGLISPKVAYAFEAGQTARLRRTLGQATLISCAFAIVAALAILVVGRPVIVAMFGAGYAHAWEISLVLAIGQLFSGLMGPTALVLNMTRAEKKTLATGLAAAVLNIALNLLLVPRYGATGAAVASSATLVAIQTQRWAMAWRHTGVRTDIIAALAHARRRPANEAPPS
jgi:O-antigen/teichoic acid export membrane protein